MKPTLAVVTAYWGDYSKYVDRWHEAFSASTVQPDELIVEEIRDHTSMGEARNRVVRRTTTDWVLHFDIDDIVRPTAIEQSLPYFDFTDVVVWNYRWANGPRSGRDQIHQPINHAVFRGAATSSSNSPFRRSAWERHPYLEITATGIDGAVDTFFWARLAKDGARFHNLTGVQFEREYHPGSMSAKLDDDENWQRVMFHDLLLAGEQPRFPDRGRRLMPAPAWVRSEIIALAKEAGVPVEMVVERLWLTRNQGR